MKTLETFKLLSIKETARLVRRLETDFARTAVEANYFIENILGNEILGILKDHDTYYVIGNDGDFQHIDFHWIWITSDLSDNNSGASSNGRLESFSENYGLPIHYLIAMADRWN